MNLLLAKLKIYFKWYTTPRYYCPYCGKKSPMKTYNGTISPGYNFRGLCWVCESKWRTRFMYYIFELLFLHRKDNFSILHTAPEKAIAKLLLSKPNINYTAIDLHPEIYPQFPCSYGDLMDLPFENSSFDYIISSQVLEHVPNDFQALREFKRVLKPNGVVILCLPVSETIEETIDEYNNTIENDHLSWENHQDLSAEERIERFGQYDHVRLYGQDIVKRIESQGFVVNEIVPEQIFPDKLLNSLGSRGVVPSNNRYGMNCNAFYILLPK